MVEQFHVSERRACRLVGLSRDSYRHPPQETEMNQALSAKIIEIAESLREEAEQVEAGQSHGLTIRLRIS